MLETINSSIWANDAVNVFAGGENIISSSPYSTEVIHRPRGVVSVRAAARGGEKVAIGDAHVIGEADKVAELLLLRPRLPYGRNPLVLLTFSCDIDLWYSPHGALLPSPSAPPSRTLETGCPR